MSFARRIVIDTGVLVSAAIRPESIPALALEKALLQFEMALYGFRVVNEGAVLKANP